MSTLAQRVEELSALLREEREETNRRVDALTLLVHEVRDHQMRRHLTNKKYNGKKQVVPVGTIPIPLRGAIDDNTLHAKGFDEHFKKWGVWLVEAMEADTVGPNDYLQRVAADWNSAFRQLAVSKSGGYFHLAIGPTARMKITDFELTGFSRKHTIPSREPELIDFRDRKIWNWARLYLCPVLEATAYLRDGKARTRKFWETLALLGSGRFEVVVQREIWDLHHEDDKMFKLLKRVWPDLQGLFKAFADGLRLRK